MKKSLFYYSEKKLKYIEIKNFYSKFISLVVFFSSIFALFFLGSFLLISGFINPESDLSKLKDENSVLKAKYHQIATKINDLSNELEILNANDEGLRLSVNLDPLSHEERNFGIGGNSFEEIEPTSTSDISDLVNEVDYKLELLKSKVVFTKNNYSKIENSLKNHLKLYKAIPAIMPTDGPIGDRFGMRLHPILKIRRMHPGVDILVNSGENIYAPGDGKIIKVGHRGGYGLTIEIDHGFGYTSLYAHLSKVKAKKGKFVKRGELIGLSGRSGSLATGPHLHYEIKHNGVLLNPKNFIFSDVRAFDLITEKGFN